MRQVFRSQSFLLDILLSLLQIETNHQFIHVCWVKVLIYIENWPRFQKTGRVEHQLVFANILNELYDVAGINEVSPSITGLKGDDIKWIFRVM